MIETARTRISLVQTADATAISDYYLQNADHLARWEPLRSPDYHTPVAWASRTTAQVEAQRAGSALHFIVCGSVTSEIVALCNFTNITHGSFQACYLGYSINKTFEGMGLMQEALAACLLEVFQTHGLNRVMANYMPTNTRSRRLLEHLGFEKEGYARNYLRIAGKWEDHILTAKLRPQETR